MRKQIIAFFLVFVVLSLASCSTEADNSELYVRLEDSYDHGYTDGYREGRIEGINYALEKIPAYLEVHWEDLLWEIDREFSMMPGEALEILDLYRCGEEVSDQEVYVAISVITQYIDALYDLASEIEDYDLH